MPEGLRRYEEQVVSDNVLEVASGAGTVADNVVEPFVPQHAVLIANFVLKSKAFMLTHNSRLFTADTWESYRAWAQQLFVDLKARAWAACLEESIRASDVEPAGVLVYHGHVYLFWDNDGAGVHLENLEKLTFNGVKPRVDKCVTGANNRAPRKSALHGLWYVYVMKNGTKASDSNLVPWRDYRPLPQWLVGLWSDHKLDDDKYLALSAQFRSGHANRRRDVLVICREMKQDVVSQRVGQELAELKRLGLKKDFKSFDVVNQFVDLFRTAAWRRPVLVIIGGSNMGKSMLAGHVMNKVGGVVKSRIGKARFPQVADGGSAS